MNGDDLRKFSERRGLEKAELAQLLNSALGRKYDGETVSRWERGDRTISKPVASFLEELAVTTGLSGDVPAADEYAAQRAQEPVSGDTSPGPGPNLDPQPQMLTGSSAWAKACEELWEMIAAGVGMVGAATGSHALVNDGAIIAADKQALGAAWGRLAETNETFRKMLVGMTEGGAWLQVAMVTGTTVSKCWQSHVAIAESAISVPDLHVDYEPADVAAA